MDPLLYARHGAESHSGHTTTNTAAASTSPDGSMGMDTHMSMMAIFQNSMSTSLFSTKWTPTNAGAYAGTCIFLIILAVIFRGLLAFKSWQELRWLDKEMNRRYVVVNGKAPLAENLSRDSLGKAAVLSENGVEENVVVVQRRTGSHARPWRLSVDPVRAVIDTVVAGVGYLLMLAVMSMNVGYFLSVLGGTFLGSLLVGRFISSTEH
ncbi:Putative protein of unknown function [Podospora comata]|uniref:Copper transport protein n=1 Tax=Podospora comata TaxID=48703 RepID=A0ABY6RYR8_PODCO|nr:Putative protein of unknown function [Podospora comata]